MCLHVPADTDREQWLCRAVQQCTAQATIRHAAHIPHRLRTDRAHPPTVQAKAAVSLHLHHAPAASVHPAAEVHSPPVHPVAVLFHRLHAPHSAHLPVQAALAAAAAVAPSVVAAEAADSVNNKQKIKTAAKAAVFLLYVYFKMLI